MFFELVNFVVYEMSRQNWEKTLLLGIIVKCISNSFDSMSLLYYN